MRLTAPRLLAFGVMAFALSQSVIADKPPPTLPKPTNAAEIKLAMQKLTVLRRVR
jgi:hypothetical protein